MRLCFRIIILKKTVRGTAKIMNELVGFWVFDSELCRDRKWELPVE